jgi:hypothetical protein
MTLIDFNTSFISRANSSEKALGGIMRGRLPSPPVSVEEIISIARWLLAQKGNSARRYARELAQRFVQDGDAQRADEWTRVASMIEHLSRSREKGDTIN